MDFALNEEQRLLQDTMRRFATEKVAPRVAEYDREERMPLDLLEELGEMGMMGGVVPECYGGADMDFVSYAVMIEELSRVCHMLACLVSFPSGLVGSGILHYGTEEQKERYLKPLAQGRIHGSSGVTEPHSGSDVAAMETTVRRDGDDYIINGAKIWISNLDIASFFLTFATLDRSLKSKGICAFIIDRNTPGLSVRPFKNKLGFRPICTGELVLDNVRVHRSQLVGEEGGGFQVAMCAVENGRLSVASRAVGIAQACLDASVGYAKERIIFGKPEGQFQLVQSKITDMVIGVETARYLTRRLGWLKDQGAGDFRNEASMAKMYAGDVAMKCATDAVQILGAYGVSDEYPVSRYFRDAKVFQIVEGSNDLHRAMIAEYALGYRQRRAVPGAPNISNLTR
ncbi:MAG: acyl-CoA dehydrogenase family protein [Sterolibacterium sp.]